MDHYAIEIARAIQQNWLNGRNYSLMHGKTGFCIFLYHLAHQTGNQEYQKIADDLLDDVFANLSSMSPVDFENGLAGIGWGIEYMVQNNFAEGNTDEILEEIDNKVFKTLNDELVSSIELTNGLTGYLLYLIYRLKKRTLPLSMAQQINSELLILAINKIYELATPQFPSVVKDIFFDLMWRFPVMLTVLSEAFKLNIYNGKINCIIKQWLPNLEAYIPSLQINRLYLATSLKYLCHQIPNRRLEKQVQILLFGTDFNMLIKEIDPNQINLRFGWPGLLLILHKAIEIIPANYPNYSQLNPTYQFIKKIYSDALIKIQFGDLALNTINSGISEGIAGVGLFDLFFKHLSENKGIRLR